MEYIYLDISHIMKKFIPCLIVVVSIIIFSSICCAKIENSTSTYRDIVWEISYKINTIEYTVRFNGTNDSFYSIYSTGELYILSIYVDKKTDDIIYVLKSKDEIKILYFREIYKLKQQ